jgi:type III pantothenate kinase
LAIFAAAKKEPYIMHLAIDNGNSRTKVATFNPQAQGDFAVVAFVSSAEMWDFLNKHTFDNVIVSSVKGDAQQILSGVRATGSRVTLTSSLPLPFRVSYRTPHTLGTDRIAAVAGAMSLFPSRNCLVIDAGTCITYDLITNEGEYLGGAISPGVRMRFEAMHKQTARLPLSVPVHAPPLVGSETESCLQSGVMNGIEEEIKGIIARYKAQTADLQVLMCGGDALFFENIDKHSIFVAPDLVLHGLRRILIHNVSS